jgi:hypothetical protein
MTSDSIKVSIGVAILTVLSFGVYDQHKEFAKQDAHREDERKTAATAKTRADAERASRELIRANCSALRNDADRRDCLVTGMLGRDLTLTIATDGSPLR